MALWYLFNSIIKKVDSTNIALKYLLLKVIDKTLDKEEVLFNYFNRS